MRSSLLTRGFAHGKQKDSAKILTVLLKNDIKFDVYSSAEEEIEISYPYGEHKRILSLLDHAEVEFLSPDGIFLRARKALRPGLIFGFLLFSLLLLFSFSFVWDIRIHSDKKIDCDRLLLDLEEAGFSVGSFLPLQNFSLIENRIMQSSSEVAWISINVSGVVAVCEVIAAEKPDPPPSFQPPSNIVAREDALITEVAAETGTVSVRVGDVVKKGTLLISGIVEGAHTTQIVSAKGAVYGQVERTFTVQIPKSYSVREEKEPLVFKRTLLFFGRKIPLYVGKGTTDATVEIRTVDTPLMLFGKFLLPVGLVTESEIPYTESIETRTEAEMTDAAIREMNARLSELPEDATLVSKKWSGEFTDEGYLLTCRTVLIMNIAENAPITLVP